MTNFAQLKMIYNQFFRLADEIRSMVENGELNEAISKLQSKDALIEKFAITKKTLTLTDAEKQEMLELDAKFIEKETSDIELLKSLRSDVALELKKVKNKIKMNRAYSKNVSQREGSMLDLSE